MRKWGLFLFVIVCTMYLVSAVPFQSSEGELIIQVPPQSSIKKNSDFVFNVHIYNTTDGKPFNDSVSCELHIYNSTGSHILDNRMLNDEDSFNEYTFTLDRGNTTGDMISYIVQCNNSRIGSFASDIIYTTRSGLILENSESILYIILTSGVFILFIILSYFAVTLKYSNDKFFEKGEIFVSKITYTKYLKIFCILSAYMCFVWLLTMLNAIISYFISVEGIRLLIRNSYIFFNSLSYPVLIFATLLTFIEIWRDILFNKQIQKFGKALVNLK